MWTSALDWQVVQSQVWTSKQQSGKVRIPYFNQFAMLAKITSKNQLTLPKSVTQAVGTAEYFDVEARAGQIILTPVRIHRGDAVRARLAELDLSDADIADAVSWARTAVSAPAMAEPAATYGAVINKPKPVVSKKVTSKKPASKV